MPRKKSNASFDLLASDIEELKQETEEFSDIEEKEDVVSDATIELQMVAKEEPITLDELESEETFESNEEEVAEVEEEPVMEEINSDDTLDVEETTSNENSDINQMFEKATSSVLEAKNIFVRNAEMKEQIDKKFAELEEARKEHEALKKADIEKINTYKEAVTQKLKDKKAELDEQVQKLKDAREKYEQERRRFEAYKQEEFERVKELKRQQKLEAEETKKELDLLADTLKEQREEIEEEKRQLELDHIRYESDKNELANNLLKFNDLVSDFTVNMDKFNN